MELHSFTVVEVLFGAQTHVPLTVLLSLAGSLMLGQQCSTARKLDGRVVCHEQSEPLLMLLTRTGMSYPATIALT